MALSPRALPKGGRIAFDTLPALGLLHCKPCCKATKGHKIVSHLGKPKMIQQIWTGELHALDDISMADLAVAILDDTEHP
jgi:hypothetical protein